MRRLAIAVLGGGNAAHAIAGDAARAGHDVRLLEHAGRRSRLDHVRANGAIRVRRGEKVESCPIACVTTDLGLALEGADLLFCAVPAFAHRAAAELTVDHLTEKSTVVVFTGGFGGLEWVTAAWRRGIEPRFTVVETHSLPYAARVRTPGEVTILLDLKHVVGGVYPARRTEEVSGVLRDLYPQISYGQNLLEPQLCNVNGIMHPPVMLLNIPQIESARGLPWWVWRDGVTPGVAKLIERMDQERLAIARAYGLRLAPLAELEWQSGYGPRGTIYETLVGSSPLNEIAGPTSLNERFITEDIPYFLRLNMDFARIAGVDCRLMRSFLEVGSTIIGRDLAADGRTLEALGVPVASVDDLLAGLSEGFSRHDVAAAQ